MAKVVVDEDTCIGCGLCVNICSEAFEMVDINGEEKSQAKEGAEEKDCVDDAISQCPVSAISKE